MLPHAFSFLFFKKDMAPLIEIYLYTKYVTSQKTDIEHKECVVQITPE